jgi:hypothetical protein
LAIETKAPQAPDTPETAAASKVVVGIVNSVAIAEQRRQHALQFDLALLVHLVERRSSQKRRRAVLKGEDDDVVREEVSYAGCINIRWWGGHFFQHINEHNSS